MDTGITVTGTGQATAPADLLRLTLSVGHDAADVAAAVGQVAEKTDAVHAALSALGVDAKDIETSTVNVYPQYKDSMAVASYRASHSITVTTRNLTGFGDLLNAAVDAVGNDLGMDGLNFDVADKQPLMDQARQLAFAQAREKAAQLAELAGQSLGSISAVTESYGHGPIPLAMSLSAKGSGAYDSTLSITPGEQTVQISLDVRWNWA
ncbi:SIMPL domain-containing protein [Kribbella sp. NPDC051620]|uniref:SIMPL domain-containing protein n=1 Tax=Kribbella sp. NPDC051620 TaxID=3364120 RepID=UPI0037941024